MNNNNIILLDSIYKYHFKRTNKSIQMTHFYILPNFM